MTKTHNLGFPRIGAARELKFLLERYWQGTATEHDVEQAAADLRQRHWAAQAELDLVPVGDFSLYDHVLDTSVLVGNLPERARAGAKSDLDAYFRAARGRGPRDAQGVVAAEMTKWFDTNYHYIVPEFSRQTRFDLCAERVLSQILEARSQGHQPKPVVLGPVSYLLLGKSTDGSQPLELLEQLLPVYKQLVERLAELEVEWVQFDEPVLVTDLDESVQAELGRAYAELSFLGVKVLVASYFGGLGDNTDCVCALPVHGLHVDGVRAPAELPRIASEWPQAKVLSVGVVDGRNVWRTDLERALQLLEPLAQRFGDRLWLAPSCSLQHVPVDLRLEPELDEQLKSWLAFALQKLEEVQVLARGLARGRAAIEEELAANRAALESRRASPRVRRAEVRAALAQAAEQPTDRASPFAERRRLQQKNLRLPVLPTTTIGSFPQTEEIRRARRQYRGGQLTEAQYLRAMRAEIAAVVREQEALGLDVLVHGEPERNDMVEYFGERLEGFAITAGGWVQSYGSRCVKPPILYGDVCRSEPLTVPFIKYAQALTPKPMKGMLTGPVTILNWSFVRDDQPREQSCEQIALAIREEVLELEAEGIGIIQIDEAALREGLPLRRSEWREYLEWAVRCFRRTAGAARDETQIHTHMCYSEFNDILDSIAELDADVITIENSRSQGELLRGFETFQYENDMGPGVYDIHAPNVPEVEEIAALVRQAAERIPVERLWVNPDCGLKTRAWPEVRAALANLVTAARLVRGELTTHRSPGPGAPLTGAGLVAERSV